MDNRTYQQIYEKLKSPGNIPEISREFSIHTGIISNIFHQKTVHNVRKYHSRVVRKAPVMVRLWKRGYSILEIAGRNDFPPVLIASILLKEMGLKSKSVIKNPEILRNKRLRNEVIQAIDNDFSFSPKAHKIQSGHGEKGEQFIYRWLKEMGQDFLTESDLNRETNAKTPDFLLDAPLDIDGCRVKWIESKAVFADEREHSRYQKKQFRFYEDLYGPGMVVYWYGFLDNIVAGNYIITDYTFFEDKAEEIDRFLNHAVLC